jgi:hypothetical protein
MVQILYRGILGGTHSWAVVGGELCLALTRLGYDIGAHCLNKESEITKPELRQLMYRDKDRVPIGIGYTIPRNLKLFNTDKKLCIYNYETTVMPPGWVKDINQLTDLVLPSSNFAKSIFIQNGVLRSKICVLPHGVDTAIYHPSVSPADFGSSKFKFLCVAQPHARKGLDLLLKAYAEEFASTEDVMLIIKTSLVNEKQRAHYEINVKELLTSFRRTHAMPEVKLFIERMDNLASLYTGVDCFVLPTRSECFCLPALEAMACKLPVIITGYGGQTDFATQANSLLISYKMVDAPRSMQYWHFDPRGKIAEPDIQHLRTLMRHAYTNRDDIKRRAELAYEQVIPRFTWDNVAEQLIDIIKQQSWAKRYVLAPKNPVQQPQLDLQEIDQSREKSYQRTVAQRKERLQALEREIESKRLEAERLRKTLSETDTQAKVLEKPFSGKISIIILNYNTKVAVQNCLESIRRHTSDINHEVIVIDNGSTDGSIETLRSFPGIRLAENKINIGVSRGWNQGIRMIDPGNDVVVLNSDIIVQENWLSKLNHVAYSNPTIGLVGCRIKGTKNNNGDLLHTGALIRRDGMGEENEWGVPLKDYGQCQVNRQSQIVVGACMYLRRQVLDEVGLFDEDYTPAYFEDSDMCLKVARAGYKVIYCGEVTLLHEHGATSRANNMNATALLGANRVKFAKKWAPYLLHKDGGVEIRGPIYGSSGYAEACRNLVAGLWENKIDVAFRPITIHPSENKPQNKNVNLIVQDAISNSTTYDIGMVFYLAEYFIQHLQGKKRRIGYTMLEVDGVPSTWVQYINTYLTELWVPSTFNQRTFAASGVRVPIKVVPLGVDTNRFNPSVVPLIPNGGKYTFLCVCEWGERKNVHLLMRAFQSEFDKKEPVQLMLRIGVHDASVNIERELSQYDLRNVVLLSREYDLHQMPSLYKSADCFVLPSSGEGFGLPYAEAMAVGLPAIGTAWSANVDFMNNENSYLLKVERIVPAMARCPLYSGFNWALPDVTHLRQLMRHVYTNKEEAHRRGMIASQYIMDNFSLVKVGEVAKRILLNK